MTIKECKITYAGKSISEVGSLVVDINGINTDSNDEESDIILSTTPYSNQWRNHGTEKSNPLSFSITVSLDNGDLIDAQTERKLKKMLIKNKFYWLNINQEDMTDIEYYCKFTNPQKVNAGKNSCGIQFTCTCNAGHAWSKERIHNFTSNSAMVATVKNLTLDIDFDEYSVYPIFEVTMTGAGSFSVGNSATSEYTRIDNCTLNEIITIDCNNDILISSTGRNVVNDFYLDDVEFISLVEGLNTLSFKGLCTIKMKYRLPIRVGG